MRALVVLNVQGFFCYTPPIKCQCETSAAAMGETIPSRWAEKDAARNAKMRKPRLFCKQSDGALCCVMCVSNFEEFCESQLQ
jgi:hypothetical protein